MSVLNALVAVALVLQCIANPSFAVDYPVYDLGALCDQSITVPCPYTTAQAGTLRLLQRPLLYCSVEIKLADNCGSCTEGAFEGKYALYFNVRNFTKYATDTVYFRKSKLLGLAVKQLNGSVSPTNNPPSVAQYKTELAESPNLFIEYVTTGAPLNADPIEVIVDFVVLEFAEQEHSNLFCDSLDEYVHRDLICDATDNRINCPGNYQEGSGFNPANDRQCSDPLPPPADGFTPLYPIFDIEQRCNDVVIIPCPTESKGRSGRLQFDYIPKSTCEVTVQLEGNCTSSVFDSFAIYLNMKQVNVFPGDSFLIYETVVANRTLRQEHKYGVNTTAEFSKAQFLTTYGKQPRVHLVYSRTSAECLYGYHIAVDYTVLHGTSLPNSFSTYCAALNGFVHSDLLCTDKNSRINCPDRYIPALSGNGAGDVQCTAEEGTPYQLLYLEHLKPTLTIPCPTTTDGRVGSLLASQNETSFRVNFTLPSGCGRDDDTFAFYFNIRTLFLSAGNSLTVYKQYPDETTMRTEKHIVGPVNQINQLSVAQYVSPFEKQPFITWEFGGGRNNDFFVINYAVYSKTNKPGSSFCPALLGYIKEDLLCDTDGFDRINCPAFYRSSLSLNPATGRYCTRPRTTLRTTTSRSTTISTTTRTTTRSSGITSSTTGRTTTKSAGSTRSTTGRTTARTTTRTTRSTARSTSTTSNWWGTEPWNWWDTTTRRPSYPTTTSGYWWRSTTDLWFVYPTAGYAASLSGGEIAGIVIGVFAGVAILIVVVVLVCRRSAVPSKGQLPVSYSTNPNVQSPVVVGHAPPATAPYYASSQPQPYPTHPAPYPAGQPKQVPPSYAAVPQGAHPTHPVTRS